MKNRSCHDLMKYFLLLLSVIGATGCGIIGKRAVKPFQRGTLSSPGMALIENPGEARAVQHMLNAREGSVGGFGGSGGGCGCN